MSSMSLHHTYVWALTGIFAAMHMVLTFLPLFVLAGGGGFISAGVVSAPLIGFLLGPVYGVVAVVIGSTIGVVLMNVGGILGPVIPIVAPAVSAFIAGSLGRGRLTHVVAVYVVGIAAFVVGPIGLIALPYIWLHTALLLLMALFVVPRFRAHVRALPIPRSGVSVNRLLLPIWFLGFIAVMGDHLVGGTLATYWFVYVLLFPPDTIAPFFIAVTVFYPLERLAVSVVLTLVLASLMGIISGGQLPLPLYPEESEPQTS
ncbi:MAG: hypothetical protein QXS20_07805 [Candidatus Thorarchaeota archaeon]